MRRSQLLRHLRNHNIMRPRTDTFDDSCFVTQFGRGPFHFVLLPGLVPDGRETFHRQQSLFAVPAKFSPLR